ncbi:MAG: hypothetical protein J6S83_02525 [Lachnospiraceae bacterium]|nr:hypothetical protein [Lachnospiraceae bacterium]
MENEIFRKKSLETLSSPESLNDYMRVTNPSVWAVLAAVILFLGGLLVWGAFASFESYATGTAYAKEGVLTVTFDDEAMEKNVESGMILTSGDTQTEITTIGRGADGRVIAGANADIPDGEYEVKVRYKSTRIMSLLFN